MRHHSEVAHPIRRVAMSKTWWIAADQLDKEQKDVIDLALMSDHVIFGPPGSGKTNLLLLRAKYLHLGDQKNIEIIVFTRTLHRFMLAGGHHYEFPSDKLKTLKKWQRGFLTAHGAEPPTSSDFQKERELLSEAITALIKTQHLSGSVECFLLDEAHDYTPREIEIFRALGKRIFAVADIRQKIYGTPQCIEALTKGVASQHTLKHHYRVGRNICALADGIASEIADYIPMVTTCNYDEVALPSTVELVQCADLSAQVDRAIEKIKIQVQAYPGELIGVICPRTYAVRDVWQRVVASDLADVALLQLDDDHPNFGDNVRVCVSTVHSAKGLEYRAVHFLNLEGLETLGGGNHRNVAYTGVTRAKTSLSMYYSGRCPGFVEQAYTAVHPVTKVPTVSELFGKALKPRA